jgi:hypothetical protein
MSGLSNEQIDNILTAYINKRDYEKERYNKIKDTEEFKILNRSRAKQHYDNNKEKKQQHYQEHKEVMNAKSCYYYYRNNNRLDDFFENKKEKYDLLIRIGFIKDFGG